MNPAEEEDEALQQEVSEEETEAVVEDEEEGGEPGSGAEVDGPTANTPRGKQVGRKASPEQQAQYNKFVDNGYLLIYPKEGEINPKIIEQLKAGNPVRGVAMAAVTVVMRLVQAAAQKNVKIDPAVILHGGAELYGDLVLLSDKLGIHKFTEEEMGAGWVMAMDMARQQMQKLGMLDPKAFERDVQEIARAAQEGRIDEVLPGLGGGKKRGGQQAAEGDSDGEDEGPVADEAEEPDAGMEGDAAESESPDEDEDGEFGGFGG